MTTVFAIRLCLIVGLGLVPSGCFAQTIQYWIGASTNNNRWAQPENWMPSAKPVNGANLVFGADARKANQNNISNLKIQSITFTNSGFTLGPQTDEDKYFLTITNGITMEAGVVGNNVYQLCTVLGGPLGVTNHATGTTLRFEVSPLYTNAPRTVFDNKGCNLTFAGAGDFAFNANAAICGSGGLTKLGSGVLTLLATNTYSGPTTVGGGRLVMSTAHAGGGSISVQSGATLEAVIGAAGTTLRCSSLTLGNAPDGSVTNEFNLGTQGNPTAPVIYATNLTTAGTVIVNVKGSGLSFGQFPLIQYQGGLDGDGFTFVLNSLPEGSYGYLSNRVGSVDLVLTPDPRVGIRIETIAFHRSTHSLVYNEDTTVDQGGAMFLILHNPGSQPQTVASLFINGVSVTNISSFRWWRVWPEIIPPNGWGAITVKANGDPLMEGTTVTCLVQTATGLTASNTAVLTTPKLRLGSIVPSPDACSIYIYLRNLDTRSYAVQSVHLNEDVTPQSVFIGGTNILPKSVGIIRVDYTEPRNPLTELAVRVMAMRSDKQPVTVAAPVRLLEGRFPLGTWDSSLYESESRMRFARDAQLDTAVGVGTGSAINTAINRYFLRAINAAGGGGETNPNPPAVARHVGNPNFLAWLVADEPDLSSDTSTLINQRELDYRRLDATHPTYVNLASNRKFNEYGHIPDIVGVDHYAMYSAPNIIPGTYITRHARLEEALEYTDVLKENTEPKRMWVWIQGVAQGTWSTQPRDWGIAIQYWMAMMGGAKGYLWFTCKQGDQAANPAQFDAMFHHTRLFSQVRNLCLYGEVMNNVTSSQPDKLVARAIVGELAVVVPVINLNYSISGLPFSPSYSLAAQSGQLSVPVPAWLEPLEQVYEVTTGGNAAVPFTRNGNLAVFNVNLGNTATTCARVFVLGRADNQPPAAPSRLNVAERPTNNRVTLSWAVPFDNFGVKKYRVFANGVAVTNVESPYCVLEFANPAVLRNTEFTVVAKDAAGNSSSPSVPARVNTWRFDDPGYNENWIPNEDIANVRIEGGVMQFDVVGARPRLQLEPVRIGGAEVGRFQIRLRNGTPGTDSRLFWATDAETSFIAARSVVLTIQELDSEFQTYEADLSGLEAWTTNLITRLRFEGPRNVTGPFAIDWMALTVTPPSTNNPPVAEPQAVTTLQGQSKAITLAGSDPDGDSLTFAVVTPPAHGDLSGALPNLVYTPDANYAGADSFTFRVSDGQTNSAPAQVSITIWADSDADGIPDWWTQHYFGHATGQAADYSRAEDDADGDRMLNLAEYLAGTNPTNPLSNLRVTSVTATPDGWRVAWTTVGGKSYIVEAGGTLACGIPFTNVSPVISVSGNGESVTNFLESGVPPGHSSRWYRIRLVPDF